MFVDVHPRSVTSNIGHFLCCYIPITMKVGMEEYTFGLHSHGDEGWAQEPQR